MKPLGFDHRNDHGPRGMLARWWYRHRVRQIRGAQARHAAKQVSPPVHRAEVKRERQKRPASRS